MLLSDSVTSTFMTRSPAGLLSNVPTPCPFSPSKRIRLSLITILPLPRDAPIVWADTTSYEPSSRIVSVTYSGSEPDWYTVPFHVPATDLTSGTATGVIGPALAQPTSEAANPTMRMTVRTFHSDRTAPDIMAILLLLD